MTAPPETPQFAEKSRWWRWGAAIVAFLMFGVAAPAFGWYEPVCEEQLSAASNAVTICRPLGLGDLPVLAGGLLILLLLWPDLSEVSIGFMSLKRLVEKTAVETGEKVDAAAEETERRIDALRVEMKADMSQAMLASQHMEVTFPPYRDLTMDGIGEVAKYSRSRGRATPEPQSWRDEVNTGPLAPPFVFMIDWAVVEAVLDWADKARVYRHTGDLAYLSAKPGKLLGIEIPENEIAEVADIVDTASTIFAAELTAARSARNFLAHQSPSSVSEDVLQSLSEQMRYFLAHTRRRVEEHLRRRI